MSSLSMSHQASPADPLSYDQPFPLEAEYFPMGLSLRIATNSERVLAEAARIWSSYPQLFDQTGVRLKIAVTPGRSLPQHAPALRGQEHLFSMVADHENFANADLRAGFGYVCVAEEVVTDPVYFRYHFLEPLVYVLVAARQFTFVHAACVALDGRAVLLIGGSGSGKTCLSYACARAGWTYLAGDATSIVNGREDNRVVGRPFEIRFRHTARRLFPELENYPRVLRPSGKTDIEADPRELNLPWTLEATASHLVFLDRSDRPIPPSVHPFCPAEARRRLEESICFGDDSIRGQQRRTLDTFLKLPTVRLRYSDLAGGEQALRSLLESAR